jgi:hypothetical protein
MPVLLIPETYARQLQCRRDVLNLQMSKRVVNPIIN